MSEPEELPARLGRFEILGRLGAGGAGHVLRARDPRLDREVAIKLLRDEVDDPAAPLAAEVARQRLVREAQAMARLDHPNVIGVHEVGEDGGRVFLVMERVDGTTVTGWLAAAPRGWRDVIAVFAQVGAGLAAAHAAGLVHRDVKPENLLVGDDGRVRVTDFGLVGVEAAANDVEPALGALTYEGAVVGTPGYMAPEQLRGQGADARSDQFALCVALYEALYGEAPFAGATFRERAAATLDGAVRAAPASTAVPASVRAAVVRGLAVDPAARWPDVPALLAALATPPARRSRGRWIAAALIVAGAAAIGGAAIASGRLRRSPRAPAPAVASLPIAATKLIDSGGCDGYPIPLDDDTLVYRHVERAGTDLRVRELRSGADRALTTTPAIDEMSPQRVAGARAVTFLGRAASSGGAGPMRVDVDDGQVTVVPGGDSIFFNPGAILAGGALYYVVGQGAQLVELRDGVVRERATFPGGYIFLFDIDAARHTAAVAIDGKLCLVDLVAPGAPRCPPTAEPIGAQVRFDRAGRVYYGGTTGIRRVDPATGVDELIVRDQPGYGLALSPSERYLLWSDCLPQLEITDVATGRVAMAASMTVWSINRRGEWVYVRETPLTSVLTFRDARGLIHELTAPADAAGGAAAIEPDGDRVVFRLNGAATSGLYLGRGPAHIPRRRLTDGDSDRQPLWIDGARVLFTRNEADGLPYLYTVDLDGGAPLRAFDHARQSLDRQLDGPLVLLADPDRTRLYLWDPTTQREREVAIPAPLGGRTFLEAELAPDGRTVFVFWLPEIWRFGVDGSAAAKVFTVPANRGMWGFEVGPGDVVYAGLSDERGAIYRAELPH